MKDYFCVYPHCLVRTNDKRVLILDPHTKLSVISEDAEIVETFTIDDNYAFPVIKKGDAFYAEAITKELGYFVNAKSSPFSMPPKLTFFTSMEKEKKALGYSTGWHIPSLIKSMSLYLNNSKILLRNEILYDQLAYPRYKEVRETMTASTWKSLLTVLKSPYLRTIFVCGDIENLLTEVLDAVMEKCNCSVVLRTSIQEFDKAFKLTVKYPNIKFDFIINDTKLIGSLRKDWISDNISFTLPVMTMADLEQLETLKVSVKCIPLIHNAKVQNDIVEQMLLSQNDIIEGVSSIEDCLRKDFVNINFWEHIALTIEGALLVGNDVIGNINERTVYSLMTDYLQRPQNLWNLTRSKNVNCKDCLFTSLCPCISIYEKQGIIKRACLDGTEI